MCVCGVVAGLHACISLLMACWLLMAGRHGKLVTGKVVNGVTQGVIVGVA